MHISSHLQSKLNSACLEAYCQRYAASRWWERALVINALARAAIIACTCFGAMSRLLARILPMRIRVLHSITWPAIFYRGAEELLWIFTSDRLLGGKKLQSPEIVLEISAFILRRFAHCPDRYPDLKRRFSNHMGWKCLSPVGFIPQGEMRRLGIYPFFHKYRKCEDLSSYLPVQEKLSLLETSPDRVRQCRQMLRVWREKLVVFLGPLSVEQVQRKYARALLQEYQGVCDFLAEGERADRVLRLLRELSSLQEIGFDPFAEIAQLPKAQLAAALMSALRRDIRALHDEEIGVDLLGKLISALGWDALFTCQLLRDLPPHRLYFALGPLFSLAPSSRSLDALGGFQVSAHAYLLELLHALGEQPNLAKARADLIDFEAAYTPWLNALGVQPLSGDFDSVDRDLSAKLPDYLPEVRAEWGDVGTALQSELCPQIGLPSFNGASEVAIGSCSARI